MLKLEGSIRIYVKSQQKVPQLDLVTLGATSRISIHSITGNKLGRGLRKAYSAALLFSKVFDPSTGFLIIVLGSLGDLIQEGRSNAYATPTGPRDI